MDSADYFMIQGLYLWGGDISSTVIKGLDTAIQAAKEFINRDSKKCVVIRREGPDSFKVWTKFAKRTNPSNTKNHDSLSIFYGTRCWSTTMIFMELKA